MSSRIVIAVEQDDNSARRTFALDGRRLRRFAWIGALGLIVFAGGIGFGGWQAHDRWGNGPTARAENAVLRTRLQSLEAQQTRVDQSLARVMAYDSKIRTMTREDVGAHALGLGPLSELEIAAAEREGGGVVLPGEELELSGIVAAQDLAPMDDIVSHLDDMEARSSDLEGRVLAEEESLQEVRAYLDDRTSLLRATPSVWPVRGWVTSHFGWRKSPHGDGTRLHSGMDIAAPIGTPIIAPADGHVVFAGYHSAYGNLVVIDHGYGLTSKYAHTSRMLVGVGERVQRGDLIARVGNTGRSTGPHLHFEVIKDGVATSPMRYLRSVPR
ncbi:MAG: M23 family metallopeptidase [Proteobacteria bacterium]|nr:M23 family metallopeptidase [Pseudomonadota bacterium]